MFQDHPFKSSCILGTLVLIAALGGAQTALAQQDSAKAEQIIQDWPETSKKAAQAMIEKYGQPQETTKTLLIWRGNGPWVRTIVYGYETDHNFPMPHKDVLEQVIHYDVPPDLFDDLAHFDGSVIAERTKGELAARCDKELANFLALNLANDVIKGEKSVQEARAEYSEAIQQVMAGNPPEITQSLNFEVPNSDVTNPDEATIKQ
ncbi:hypothetical protein [Rhodoligotrophos defluvii]|uniref:hypothetical protein n=1 Tax=Rhodoligotrophos defluvii TaxID=2561934 RepID=UPI0010CA177E|nr:hypothetical protein [Rhodoligotrophos defluvii]